MKVLDFWETRENHTPRDRFVVHARAYQAARDAVGTVRSPESGVLTAEVGAETDVPEQGPEKVAVGVQKAKPKFTVISSPEGKIIGVREGTWVRSPESGDWAKVD